MQPFGFCGPSYQSTSPNVDCERTLNFYLEPVEAENKKGRYALLPTEGLGLLGAIPNREVPLMLKCGERVFTLGASELWEILADGGKVDWGAVTAKNGPQSMCCSATEILICSGGAMWTFQLATNALAIVGTPPTANAILQVLYNEGYFIAIEKNTNKFYPSSPLDATTWDPTEVIAVSEFPDNILWAIADHGELWLMGVTKTLPYQLTGSEQIFEPVQSGFIEQGIGAAQSIVRLDNSIFWIGADERGQGIGWRANGYTPVRITNHAIEWAWAQYSTIADAVAFSYQNFGHSFWVIYFPTANRTWVYDASVGMWHERGDLDPVTGTLTAWRAMCHAFAFGKHLVGDWMTGSIFELSQNYKTDFGNPILRERVTPHVCKEKKRIRFDALELDMETGLGPQPPLFDAQDPPQPRDPEVTLEWSDDSAKTWSNIYSRGFGQAGKFKTRVRWLRLGIGRDRVFRLRCADPVDCRIAEAYIETSAGPS